MNNKWSSIEGVIEAEVELIRRKSALLLQRKHDGFNGELKTSGSIIETFVKGLLQRQLSLGHRICSGYVGTPDNLNSLENLAQHDILIVDSRIPPLYKFEIGDIEVVPAEAVCAVFEVKRTLNPKILQEAIQHLNKTRQLIESCDNRKAKNQNYTPQIGPNFNPASTIPIYGIIAMDITDNCLEADYLKKNIHPNMIEFLDIVWSLSNPFLTLHWWKSKENQSDFFASNGARNTSEYFSNPVYEKDDPNRLYKYAILALRTWLANTTGVMVSPEQTQRYFGIK